MLPSLVRKISKGLSLMSRGEDEVDANATTGSHVHVLNKSNSADGTHDITVLRRLSTTQVLSDEEQNSDMGLTKKLSKVSTTTTRSFNTSLRAVSKRVSKVPSRYTGEKMQVEELPRTSSRRRISEGPEGSTSRRSSRNSSRQPMTIDFTSSEKGTRSRPQSLNKMSSLRKACSVSGPIRSRSIVAKGRAMPVRNVTPGGKTVWYFAGAYLAVRSAEDGFYLCRAARNVYNCSKEVKIRWLGKKQKCGRNGKKKKVKLNLDDDSKTSDCGTIYQLSYADTINPASILMEVSMDVTANGRTMILNDEDKEEAMRLLNIAQEVESGIMAKEDIGDDVEEVIVIEPPAPKKRKLDSGSSVEAKRPKVKKTLSQKEKEKARRAEKRKNRRNQNEAEGKPKLKRKVAAKEDELELHPNPRVKVQEKDPLWDAGTHMPFISKYGNSRLAFRAINLNDRKLLKKLLKDSKRIYCLSHIQSQSCSYCPLQYALYKKNWEAFNLLYEDYFGKKYRKRLEGNAADKIMIGRLGTGSYNFRSLGVGRIRALMASRGSREGNNALTKDKEDMRSSYDLEESSILHTAMEVGASKEIFFRIMHESDGEWESSIDLRLDGSLMQEVVRNLTVLLTRGHNVVAGELMGVIAKQHHRYRRFPFLITKVLMAKDCEELKNLPPSQLKTDIKELKGFTAIHAAACNPNPAVLERVLSADPDFHKSNAQGHRPIHMAAGCSISSPLKLLLEKGANPYDCDNKGFTALHFAIQAERVENVQILLQLLQDENSRFVDPTQGKSNGGINRTINTSETPLHMAAKIGNLNIVQLLLKHGATVDAKLSISSFCLTPLMVAAGRGHLDIVRCLVEAGAVVQQKDRLGRTAVIHAVMNGSTSVLSYLLNIGASPNRADSSGNSPLHYASAYGWYFCVKTLLEAGADPCTSNDWQTTPLSVAYLKGHFGIVAQLLDTEKVNVNHPDEEGLTLLSIACSSEPEDSLIEQIEFLVKEKNADCTVVDTFGRSVLHHLAQTEITESIRADDKKPEEIVISERGVKNTVSIAHLLLENGCSPLLQDKEGNTAAVEALRKKNIPLAKLLVENGCQINVATIDDPLVPPSTLLHFLAETIFEPGDPNLVIKFLTETVTVNGLKKNFSKELCDMAQTCNSDGLTPFLAACKTYSARNYHHDERNEVLERKRWEQARAFLKNLVEVANSDINASVGPCWTDLNERGSLNRTRSSPIKWTPVFYLVRAADPWFDASGHHVPEVKCSMLKYLLSLGPEVNIYSHDGQTPLSYAIIGKHTNAALLMLREGKVDLNLCQLITKEKDGTKKALKIPPICLAAQYQEFELLNEMLKNKVNVGAVDEDSEKSVLHILAEKSRSEGSVQAMEKILDAGLNVNIQDRSQMTPLHILVNANMGGIDSNFDAEMLMLRRKADLARRDDQDRTPLHYVFSKKSRETDKSRHDPVELCKILAKSMTAEEVNAADKHGSTPLHLAARRGASICCMYLLQRGADPSKQDGDGNSPLTLAVSAGHDNCGSILIQHGADLLTPVVHVTVKTEEKRPVWKWKELRMAETTELVTKTPLFQVAIKNDLVGVTFLLLEKSSDKTGISLSAGIEMAIKNSQYNVALRMLSTAVDLEEVRVLRSDDRNLLHVLALYANSNEQQQIKVAQVLMDKGIQANDKDKYGCTPLLYAVYSKNFKLANFLSELPDGVNVKFTDNFDRSYITAALWRCFYSGFPAELWEWLEMLIKKKADINRKFDYPLPDSAFPSTFSVKMRDPNYWRSYVGSETTALIFALRCRDFIITHNLLQWGANANQTDSSSLTPLMHAVKINSLNHVKQLMRYDYDPNYKPKEAVEAKPQSKQKQVTHGKMFRLTKAISATSISSVSSSSDEEEEKEEKRAAGKLVGKKNNKEMETVKKTSAVKLDQADKNGWTAMHYVACPLEMGTFDNEEMVFVLAKAGAKLNVKNKMQQTPLDLALANGAPKVAAMLQKLMAVSKEDMKLPSYEKFSCSDGITWTGRNPDFHNDAEKQLAGEQEMEEDQDEKITVEVSQYCSVKNGTLVMDAEQGLPYEVLMTKCDACLGMWGLYNFYHIQLVHQPGKKMYVLFTRWGRIGDVGQYQHTPFQNEADGVKEFKKIFRQKSGNKWDDVKSFEQKPKKYRLVPYSERLPPRQQKNIEFNFETEVKSVLPKCLQDAVKVMMDVKALERMYNENRSLDPGVLPFGRISRERLLQARQLLEDMRDSVQRIDLYRGKRGDKTTEEKDEHQADCQKVSELSTEYFQLIPQKNFVYEMLRPLDRKQQYNEQVKLVAKLLDYEVASKMLLAAMYRRTSVNPVDYVYRCLQIQMEMMREDDPMVQYILRSVYASDKSVSVEAVYKLARHGEEERMQKNGLGNKWLLWHGTRRNNLLSILHRGLVETPLDASQISGAAFGKGIYFSNDFEKSKMYCDSREDCSFILLCEVALGTWQDVNMGGELKTSATYDSIFVQGRRTPEPAYNISLPTGVTIALGEIEQKNMYFVEETQTWEFCHAAYNEFVVRDESQVCLRYLLQFH